MHVVDNLFFVKQDNQVLADKHDSLLLHLLWNPDAGILGNTEHAADYTDISAVEVAGAADVVRITRGNGNL